MAVNKRIIKSAVDNVLSTHGIVDSGIEGKLSDMSMNEIRQVIGAKFRGNQEYLGRASLLHGIGNKDEIHGLLKLKEDFFGEEFIRLENTVKQSPQLKGFQYDGSLVKGGSFEIRYNEYQRQLRNFADKELEGPNKAWRQKLKDLDPNYDFSRYNKLSWARQNEIFEADYAVHEKMMALRSDILNLDPNYNADRLSKMSWKRQASIMEGDLVDLQYYASDINELKKEIYKMNPNFDESRLAGKSLRSQFHSLSNTLLHLDNKTEGIKKLRERLESIDQVGFNQLWNEKDSALRREIRRAWDSDKYVYREGDTYYRSGIDASPVYTPPPVNRAPNQLEEKFNQLSTMDHDSFQAEWNNLSSYEKNLYTQRVSSVDTFRGSDGKLYSVQDGNASQLSTMSEQVKQEYQSWLANRDMALSFEANQFSEAARNARFLGDRQQLQFERAERSTQDEITGYTPVEKSPVGGRVEQATEETKAITTAATEQRTVGETEAARIERVSMNSILATDTAASYVFGYKQKALIGAMGTLGAISLLEANSSSGGREALERKRMLEEQRRMKKYGY